MDIDFEPSQPVADASGKAAERFAALAHQKFGVVLDFSDASLQALEQVAGRYERTMPVESTWDDKFREPFRVITELMGAYLGEVACRNHGAMWGWATDGTARVMACQTPKGIVFWPVVRVEKRLRGGAENDLWSYYATMVGQGVPSR